MSCSFVQFSHFKLVLGYTQVIASIFLLSFELVQSNHLFEKSFAMAFYFQFRLSLSPAKLKLQFKLQLALIKLVATLLLLYTLYWAAGGIFKKFFL